MYELLTALPTSSPLMPSMLGIFGILLVATFTAQLLTRVYPQADFTEVHLRIRSWWVMAGIFSIALLVDRRVSILFMALISYLALKEYLSIVPTRPFDRRILQFAYITIPIQFLWVVMAWYGMFIVFIPVWMFLVLPVGLLLTGQTKGFLNAASSLHWGVMLTVFSISHMAFLLTTPLHVSPIAGGGGLVLFLVLLTQVNDVAQYLFGKMLGKHKATPRISPGKTWEGLAGGVLITTLLAWLLAPILTPLTAQHAIIIGFILGLCGFLGDITMSALKRDLNLKDTGALLPGHGGILDRIDSLIYTAPIFFHFMAYFYG